MQYRCSRPFVVAALTLIAACADNAPTNPQLTATDEVLAARKPGGAAITAAIDQTAAGIALVGELRITRFAQSSTGQLLVSGVFTGTADGVAFTQRFTNVAATLSSASAAAATTSASRMASQVGSCDILLLDLGPLHLDILGLEVDLSRVVLDITAQAGAGNLLGNLLCAVVHLLDGPGLLSAVVNLLNQINALLGAL